MSRDFDLADILTVTTGRLFTQIGALYDLLNYMTGDNLFTHQLPRACDECRPELIRQHPALAAAVPPDEFRPWLDVQRKRLGSSLPVEPLAASDHTAIDPIAELRMMVDPDTPIIAVGFSP